MAVPRSPTTGSQSEGQTAHRVRNEINQVFRYAIATGRAKSDPSRDLIGAIPPAVEKYFASITEPAKVAEMLRAFEGFSGTFPVLVPLATQSLTMLNFTP